MQSMRLPNIACNPCVTQCKTALRLSVAKLPESVVEDYQWSSTSGCCSTLARTASPAVLA